MTEIENFEKNNDKKSKENKAKVILICSIISLVIVILGIVAYNIVSNKYAKMVENSINDFLSLYQEQNAKFTYEPVKCSGVKTIKCSSQIISNKQLLASYDFNNPIITLSPSVDNFDISFKADLALGFNSQAGITIGTINTDIHCDDRVSLIKNKSLMENNISCNISIGDKIKSQQKSLLYSHNEAFAENDNILSLLLKGAGDKDGALFNKIMNKGFVAFETSNKIYSDNLLEDFTNLLANLSNKDENFSSDKVVSTYENMKEDYNKAKELFPMEQGQMEVVDSLIAALDGVILNGDNELRFSVDLKNKEDIDGIFSSKIVFGPEYYNIVIESGK